jgi:GNAT superfamily N-acetyltransferase
MTGRGADRVDGPRACRESEFEETVALINSVFRAGTDQDISTDYPLIFRPPTLEYHRVLSVNGEIAAHVPVAPREVVTGDDRFTIGIIGPTVTHPDHRRRGYATRCLQDVVRVQEDRGWPVSVLWTREATFPFYWHSGWEAVGPQGHVHRLESDDRELFSPGSYDVVRFDPSDDRHLDFVATTHDAHPQRVLRSRADHRALMTLPKVSTYLATAGGEPVAFLVIGEGVNKPGLIEGGGDLAGLEALVRWALELLPEGGERQVPVPLTPSPLGRLMEARLPAARQPVEEAAGIGYQMMRVNSVEKLMNGIRHHLRSRSEGLDVDMTLVCTDSGESVGLAFRDGDVEISPGRRGAEVALTRREIAQLVFGPHRASQPLDLDGVADDVLNNVFPFYFPIWELDHC